jgi:putative flippase GtrA
MTFRSPFLGSFTLRHTYDIFKFVANRRFDIEQKINTAALRQNFLRTAKRKPRISAGLALKFLRLLRILLRLLYTKRLSGG